MIVDPFLLAHEIGPYLYDLSARFNPISIRDQMVRARLLVDRLVEDPELRIKELGLLVVGAGAAGATAAIRAAQSGVNTLLIDENDGPFWRQAGCSSRYIDPTMYDWPVAHWGKHHFPWAGAMPLSWRGGRSNQVALVWKQQLNAAITRSAGRLKVLYQTRMTRPPRIRPAGDYSIRFHNHTYHVGGIIYATGFHSENTTIGKFSGFRFWDNDSYENVNCGLKSDRPAVLISGGGDGALQDFMRILLKNKALTPAVMVNGLGLPMPLLLRLQSLDDQCVRSLSWGVTKEHDHNVLQQLHAFYRDEVEKLYDRTISDLIEREWQPDHHLKLTIVHRCMHFGICYGLNRFLALLLIHHLVENGQNRADIIREESEVSFVEGATGSNHRCANDAKQCHGKYHQVKLSTNIQCARSVPGEEDLKALFNIVLVRHGLELAPLVKIANTKRLMLRSRQMLPYYIIG